MEKTCQRSLAWATFKYDDQSKLSNVMSIGKKRKEFAVVTKGGVEIKVDKFQWIVCCWYFLKRVFKQGGIKMSSEFLAIEDYSSKKVLRQAGSTKEAKE